MIALPLRQAWIWWTSLPVVVLFVLANAAAGLLQATGRAPPELFALLDMDTEASLPAWFSSMLLFGGAILLAAVAAVTRRIAESSSGRWAGLAVIFLLLSIDEAVAFHERAIDPVREWLGVGGALYFAWVIPAMLLLLVFAAVYLPFWWRLPPRTRMGFAIAGVLYVGGALGMELVGAYLLTKFGAGIATGITVLVEETAEMLGAVVFLHYVTGYLQERVGALPAGVAGTRNSEEAARPG